MSLRLRLVLVMALLTVVPALSAGVLSRRLIGQSFDLGLSEELDAALDAGVRRARSEHRRARADLEADVARLAAWLRSPGHSAAARERWSAAVDAPAGDRVEWTDAGITTVLQAGAVPLEVEVDNDAPAVIEVEREVGPGQRLHWIRPVEAEWRDDASHLATTLQMVRGVRAERDTFERTFWIPFLAVYALTLTVGLVVAWRVSRGITAPVHTLLEGTEAVAAGRWDVQLPEVGGSEIGRLTTRFNAMVRTLDAQSRRLVDLETMAGWREMARALAHEVKNPLTPIQLTVEEMRERYSGDDAHYRQLLQDCSRIVVEEVESLRSVVTRFREFSRPVEPRRVREDVGSLVRDVGALQRDLEVTVEVEPDLVVDIDQDRIRQVLMNLCENSRKAMADQSERRLALSARRRDRAVVIEVEDAGPGIPEDERARVFEPYRTGGDGGLGLGLALVKGIVLAHDGSIEIDRSRWGGARFRIEIPWPEEGT